MRQSTLCLVFLASLLSSFGLAQAAPSIKSGLSFEQRNLAELQRRYRKGTANPQPWTAFWWPYSENGIANDRYSQRSPAQKLDEAQGTGGVITAWEQANHGYSQASVEWWGHCNGWATAALMEEEPRSPVTVNGVQFEIGDRKAALSEYWLESGSDFLGTRVDNAGDFSSDAFWDVIPAHLYLLLTNIVGRERHAVILDRHTGSEVWNQPLIGYEIKPIRRADYLGPDTEYPNVYRVNVTVILWWGDDNVEVNDVTPKFDWHESRHFVSRQLRMELWVDAPLVFDDKGRLTRSGNIIVTDRGYGGQWKNGTDSETLVNSHPDFIWLPLSYTSSTGYKNPNLNDAWVHSNLSN